MAEKVPKLSLTDLEQECYLLAYSRQGVKMARQQLPLVPIVKTTVRFPQELYRRLKIKAIEESRPVAILIADAVEVYLSASGGKQAESRRK